ncbi:MAG: hypothetical protein IH933_06560 [Euryarchaeota archaeon]|nr:hypothetical protein [Euryarchaeota archaeon]
MRRRQLLKSGIGVAGLAFVSGCSDIELGIGENDEFDDSDPDAMLPSEERVLEVLEGNWVREDPDSIDEPLVDDANAASQYHRSSDDPDITEYVEDDPRIETPGEVTIGIWIYDDAGGAQGAYEDHPDQRRGFEITDVADESIVGTGGPSGDFPQARVLFRDANAVGWVSYRNVDIDSIELYEMTAIDLAEATHEQWREE